MLPRSSGAVTLNEYEPPAFGVQAKIALPSGPVVTTRFSRAISTLLPVLLSHRVPTISIESGTFGCGRSSYERVVAVIVTGRPSVENHASLARLIWNDAGTTRRLLVTWTVLPDASRPSASIEMDLSLIHIFRAHE